MALDYKTDEGQKADDRLNPYEMEREATAGYDRADGDLGDQADNMSNINSARDKESNSGGGWKTNVSNSPTTERSGSGAGFAGVKNKLKKGGPIGAIAGGALGITAISGMLAAPGLYVVHIIETITQRWDSQQVSMHNSNMKAVKSKIDKKTKGYCGKKVSFRCKFSSFSDKELDKLKQQGIEPSKGKQGKIAGLVGRSKPTGFTYTDSAGKVFEYSPAQFSREVRRPGSTLSRSFYTAYHPKLGGFADKMWKKTAGKLKISKNRPFTGDEKTKKDRWATLRKISQSGSLGGAAGRASFGCQDPENCTAEEKDAQKKAGDANTFADEADAARKNGTKFSATQKLAASVGLFGFADGACMALQTLNSASIGAKVIMSGQLAAFGMAIATTAHTIKAGDGVDTDVTFISDILTETRYEEAEGGGGTANRVETKPATDSASYKNTAYGDRNKTSSLMTFAAGNVATRGVTNLKNTAYGLVGGKNAARRVCKTLGNPFVQAGGIVAGGVTTIFGVGVVKGIAQTTAMAGTMYTLQTLVLPKLINIMAGVAVDEDTVGELAGDALVTGYQKTANTVSSGGGNAPLTPGQAAENSKAMRNVAMEYGAFERANRSPFDPYSQHTMVGSVVNGLLPYTVKMKDFNSIVSTLASLVTGSLSNIISPKVAAADFEETAADYVADDEDYKAGNFATTINQVVVTGLPQKVLDIEPDAAYKRLVGHKKQWCDTASIPCTPRIDPDPHINWETGEPQSIKYKRFVENCIDRPVTSVWSDPEADEKWKQGDSGENDPRSKGERDCQVSDSGFSTGLQYRGNSSEVQLYTGPADPDGIVGSGITNQDTILTPQERNDFYAHYNYLRTVTNREEDYPSGGSGESSEGSNAETSGGGGPGAPGNTAPSGKGWRLKNGEDYSSAPCAAGTKDTGTQTHQILKMTYRTCEIDGAVVTSVMSDKVMAIKNGAKAAGINLTVNSGVRTYAKQQALYSANCGGGGCSPPTAKPGTSSHEFGVAIDWGVSGKAFCFPSGKVCPGNPGYDYMVKNGAAQGFHKLPSEAWHWSMDGR